MTPDEENIRIKSINIPSPRSMGKNTQKKFYDLMKEMRNFTGAPAQGQSFNRMNYEEYKYKERDPLILFYGFNGMLAQKYSVIRDMTADEITVRMQIAGDKVPYSIKEGVPFGIVINQMKDTPNALSEISFDDAMNIIRIGIEKLKVEEFIDADEDEFDDNCVEACKPGLHACGK